jgi:pimeloyl-ACP methyl ester carboxylesterase
VIQHNLSLCGTQCAVHEYGSSDGEPIILLHGWLDNLASFETLIPFFKQYRVIALDFPGHGFSSHLPEGMAYHFFDLVYVIQDLIAAFKLDSVTLIGHSMGGAASTLVASVNESVKRLILLEALGPLTVSAKGTVELMQKALAERAKINNKSLRLFESEEQAISVRASHSNMDADIIAPIVRRGLLNKGNGFQWRSDPRLRIASINRLTESQLEPLLKKITCPVLLIEADKGLFADNQAIQARKQLLNNLTTKVLTGGHHVHMEQPEKTAAMIVDFIEKESLD